MVRLHAVRSRLLALYLASGGVLAAALWACASAPAPPSIGAGSAPPEATPPTATTTSTAAEMPPQPPPAASTSGAIQPAEAPTGNERPLLQQYPAIAAKVPFAPLAAFPTPVQRLDALGRHLGIDQLYIKRDDLAGEPFGGSKVRKLELLLGEARQAKKTSVITFGGVGSNQALATALYARRLDLQAVLLLVPHPTITDETRYKLLAEHSLGAEMRHFQNVKRAEAWAMRVIHRGHYHWFPMGGSTPLGNLGFVNAGFELAAQVKQGALPEPTRVYIAAGTMGSAAGLFVGLRAAGLSTKVIAVQTAPRATQRGLDSMIRKTLRYLHSLDPTFPQVDLLPGHARVERGYLGFNYGHETPRALKAIATFREHTGIELEPTYTAKTFAALEDDSKGDPDDVVVFWNTYDSRKIAIDDVAVADLPPAFHCYFNATGSMSYRALKRQPPRNDAARP